MMLSTVDYCHSFVKERSPSKEHTSPTVDPISCIGSKSHIGASFAWLMECTSVHNTTAQVGVQHVYIA